MAATRRSGTTSSTPSARASRADEEECYDWLWDNCGRDIVGHAPKPVCLNDIQEVCAMDTFAKRYGHIARMMAEDMPWHEYIVIDCY